MQDPNEDTEWNDILRSKGILPPKKEKEITEDEIVNLLEQTIKEKQEKGEKKLEDCSLDELDELEDLEDERVILEYRNKRLAEMRAFTEKAKFGTVMEISGQDYVNEINKAGEGVWVILHLYKTGIPLCSLLNMHLAELANKFPATKFVKSISTTCIPNYPDKNLPTIFVYFEGAMKAQFIGPQEFRRQDISCAELEWMLGKAGAVPSDMEEDPRPKERPRDILYTSLRHELGGISTSSSPSVKSSHQTNSADLGAGHILSEVPRSELRCNHFGANQESIRGLITSSWESRHSSVHHSMCPE